MANIITAPEVDALPVSSIRKQMKKLYSAVDYAKRYNRANYYQPHPETQLPFHCAPHKERAIILGSQQGKSHAASYEMSYALLGRWPEWHRGRHQMPPLSDPTKLVGWYASNSSQSVRDNAQEKLFGPVSQKDGLGTGAIPLDAIEGVTMARGISNFIDTGTIRRDDGGVSLAQSRTYEQDVRMWQGVPVSIVWMDEDPGMSDDLYNEAMARTIATNGCLICSLTPMMGETPLTRRYENGGPQIFCVEGGIEKALHIPKERHAEIEAATPEHERPSRIHGKKMMGAGAVFRQAPELVTFDQSVEDFQWEHWPVANFCDFSHGGQSASAHPMAYITAIRDPATRTDYIIDAQLMHQMTASEHVAFIKANSKFYDAPWGWPHDGSQVASADTGETYSRLYRRLGLPFRPEHVTWPTGGYSFDAGIAAMQMRFHDGTLLVARHLVDWFREYQNYHYKDGRIVKENDDLMSATRQLVMSDMRFAKVLDVNPIIGRGQYRGYEPGHSLDKRSRAKSKAYFPDNGADDYSDFGA